MSAFSSLLNSPPDSPVTASSSATDVSASYREGNAAPELTSTTASAAGDRPTVDDWVPRSRAKHSGSGGKSMTAAESAMELRLRTDRSSYCETQVTKGAKPAHRPTPLLDIAARQEEPCCPSSIPQKLLTILESDTVYSSGRLLRVYRVKTFPTNVFLLPSTIFRALAGSP